MVFRKDKEMRIKEQKNLLKLMLVFFFLISSIYANASFDVPITYQGTVTMSGGTAPSDGNYAMLFSLWNLKSGGDSATNRLWYETYANANAVTVTKGAFSVELGSITPFPTMLFMDNPNLWLQVSVDLTGVTGSGFQIFSPRVRFSASPYSYQSYRANMLGSLSSASFLRSDEDDISSANLTINGVIQAGTNELPVAYNRIGDGTATKASINYKNDLLINGDLEVKHHVYWGATKISYYSMNPIDFHPYRNIYNYYCSSTSLFKTSGDTNSQTWYAPVHIPDDAEVTNLSVWYYDYTNSGNITVNLDRKPIGTTSTTTMASVASSGTPGAGSGSDLTITDAVISNFAYTYCVTVYFPSADIANMIQLRSVRITYKTIGP